MTASTYIQPLFCDADGFASHIHTGHAFAAVAACFYAAEACERAANADKGAYEAAVQNAAGGVEHIENETLNEAAEAATQEAEAAIEAAEAALGKVPALATLEFVFPSPREGVENARWTAQEIAYRVASEVTTASKF